MNEKQLLFFHSQRAEIARTVYTLCKNRFEECYTSRVHRELAHSKASYKAVHGTIHRFEELGWITRSDSRGRAKPVTLTDRGETVFQAISTLLELLEDESREIRPGTGQEMPQTDR